MVFTGVCTLVMLNDNSSFELHCYSLNGTFYKKIEGNFTDFKLTEVGTIIINDIKNNNIDFYKGCHLNKIYSKHFSFINDGNDKNVYLFDFQNPDIIYFCCKDNEYTSINKVLINIEDQKR